MEKEIIATTRAPAALGPYSQACRAGNLVFTAGQVGLDPDSGQLVGGLEAQVRQVMANLSAVLEAAGSGLAQVMKTTIFLADMSHFAQVNAVYAEYFPEAPPARSTVQVARLPLNALVEIEAIGLCEG